MREKKKRVLRLDFQNNVRFYILKLTVRGMEEGQQNEILTKDSKFRQITIYMLRIHELLHKLIHIKIISKGLIIS